LRLRQMLRQGVVHQANLLGPEIGDYMSIDQGERLRGPVTSKADIA
jgi:hypothetical protein